MPIKLSQLRAAARRGKNKHKLKHSEAQDPCWKGYHMVGKRRKGKRMVPNCVPDTAKQRRRVHAHIEVAVQHDDVRDGGMHVMSARERRSYQKLVNASDDHLADAIQHYVAGLAPVLEDEDADQLIDLCIAAVQKLVRPHMVNQ